MSTIKLVDIVAKLEGYLEQGKAVEVGDTIYIPAKRKLSGLTDEEMAALEDYKKPNISYHVIRGAKRACIGYSGLRAELAEAVVEDNTNRKEVAQLRSKLKALQSEYQKQKKISEFFEKVLQEAADRPVKSEHNLGISREKGKEGTLAGIPTLLCSDWHFDEIVEADQIQGFNKYNPEIAKKRIERLFSKTGNLLFNHMAGARYDGLVIALGGDMVSGIIHEELERTNANTILVSVMQLRDIISEQVKMLSKEFRKVSVVGVVGNHGRLRHKPTAKYSVEENFDYLIYELVARELAGIPNISMDVSKSPDFNYQLYRTRYNLTHGNQYKGGSGVGGIWPSLMRGDNRKRKRESITGNPYDYAVMGHFHRYGMIDNVIVNGSLKGYDEYAYQNNFDFQRATQALWVTHPDEGITFSIPVYVDSPEEVLQQKTMGFTMGSIDD
jgi:hypothetical protein